MPTLKITDAVAEPLTLADVKAWTRIDVPDDDALVSALMLPAARHAAEALMQRSIMPTQWRLALDAFPCGPIRLQYPQLISVQALKYWDIEGVEITVLPADYLLDTTSAPSWVAPVPGKTWPATQLRINAVTLDYTAGWANAAAVPTSIKQWIARHVATAYDNRQLMVQGQELRDLPGMDGLLAQHTVWGI